MKIMRKTFYYCCDLEEQEEMLRQCMGELKVSGTFFDELWLLMTGFDRGRGAEIVLSFKCLVLSW